MSICRGLRRLDSVSRLSGAVLGLAICLMSLPAMAAGSEIGNAITVEKTVTGTIASKIVPVGQGDSVFKDEIVDTAKESLVRIRFLDDTSLFVGPSSSVKLDTFVYNPDNTASKLVVSASKGAFRFISGKSDHSAYEIRTPYGSLGVAGTKLGFVIANGQMVAILKEGAMVVCPHARLTANRSKCIPVTQPNTGVIVNARGALGPVPKSSNMSDFGDLCGNLCAKLFPE
jgi:hypothetical protein